MTQTAGRNDSQFPTSHEHPAPKEPRLTPGVQQCLANLLTAYESAVDLNMDIWEFAVEMPILLAAGLSSSDLRWLVCKGYVQHAREVPTNGPTRSFEEAARLTFRESSCFTLTAEGIRFAREQGRSPNAAAFFNREGFLSDLARQILHGNDNHSLAHDGISPSGTGQSVNGHHVNGHSANSHNFNGQSLNGHGPATDQHAPHIRPDGESQPDQNAALVPVWDRDRHELRVGGELVKVFRLPSPNQEAVLMAFHEDEWPARIDDPLPPVPEMEPKRRLHDTIKSLNRNQKTRLLRFMGDGTGEGVLWELVTPPPKRKRR